MERRSDASTLMERPGDTALVLRGHARLIVMMCPCGCGEQIIVNVDSSAGPAWSIYCVGDNLNELTIYPSIWRDTGCRSHFIVWRGRILGIGMRRTKIDLEDSLIGRVNDALTPTSRHYFEIATELSENPWSVLWACQELVQRGVAVDGGEEGMFKKTVLKY